MGMNIPPGQQGVPPQPAVPGQQGLAGQQFAPDPLIQEVSFPLFQSKGWIMFLGILSIVMGVMVASTLVGIIIAWLPIWIGILLFQAASNVEKAQKTGQKIWFLESMGKLKLFFTIMGIFYLINILFTVIMIASILGLGLFGGGFMEGFNGVAID